MWHDVLAMRASVISNMEPKVACVRVCVRSVCSAGILSPLWACHEAGLLTLHHIKDTVSSHIRSGTVIY